MQLITEGVHTTLRRCMVISSVNFNLATLRAGSKVARLLIRAIMFVRAVTAVVKGVANKLSIDAFTWSEK